MSGRDVGGAYKSDLFRRHYAAERRQRLRAAGVCINGGAKHGPVNPKSGKCAQCDIVAERTR